MSSAKKILVTGGSGFIGSHIVENLVRKNHTVCVVDLWESKEIKDLKSKHKNITFKKITLPFFHRYITTIVYYKSFDI